MSDMVSCKNEGTENSRSFDADRDYELWWLIMHMRRAMHKARGKELSKYGITPEEAAVLFTIQAISHAATPAEISRWLLREPHSISGLLNRMQKEGLITKAKDLERKNLVRVAMTEKGRQAYSQSTKRESIHRILTALSEKECQQIRTCLEKLRNKALEELGTASRPPFPPSR